MFYRRLTLWLLLIVVGFNSTIGLPMHEAMHVGSETADHSLLMASDLPVNAHQDFIDTEACAFCCAYTHLFQVFISLELHISSHEMASLHYAASRCELLSSLWLAYSSGCDPPTAIV